MSKFGYLIFYSIYFLIPGISSCTYKDIIAHKSDNSYACQLEVEPFEEVFKRGKNQQIRKQSKVFTLVKKRKTALQI